MTPTEKDQERSKAAPSTEVKKTRRTRLYVIGGVVAALIRVGRCGRPDVAQAAVVLRSGLPLAHGCIFGKLHGPESARGEARESREGDVSRLPRIQGVGAADRGGTRRSPASTSCSPATSRRRSP